MSISDSNKSINNEVENFYDFEAPMYCPYYSMPYTRSIQDEYTDAEPYDDDFYDDFDPGYRYGRRRRRRHRRRRRGFPLWPLLFFYDDWY
ncbi:hypothetical protein ACJDU8_18355 [Clostridium sp. WILCCON 0269]|uniref:Spore coat protein n=1 Tax=Candidatus Clostridium eludens TaxID=3381663 RepID=A0ABW8SN73_9CLOT